MSNLRELYQEVIIDHSQQPRNYGEIDCDHHANGVNPLCGDNISVHLRLEGETIQQANFTGQSCAICTASASIMTELVQGKSEQEARECFKKFHDMVMNVVDPDLTDGKLAVLAGVKAFPMRVKCATLAWHTLIAALEGETEAVSTEN